MKKAYEIRHYPDNNPAWQVESFWTDKEGYEQSACEGEFYNRKNARLFIKALKDATKKPMLKAKTKVKLKGMWALAIELAEADAYRANHLPPTRPDKCYVRLADSDIVDYGETMADGRIQTGNHGIINQHDFICWEWSTNLNVWKRIT